MDWLTNTAFHNKEPVFLIHIRRSPRILYRYIYNVMPQGVKVERYGEVSHRY
jgi:hypothetical protein